MTTSLKESQVHEWNLQQLPGFSLRTTQELRVIWFQEMPPDRDTNPALWDTLLGFFEEAAVSICSRPGNLVITPRALLRQLKFEDREPSAGRAVILELFRRGDLVRADAFTLPNPSESSSLSTSSLSSAGIRSFIQRNIWGPPHQQPPALDDPIVPTAALAAAGARAKAKLGGPVSSDDIHTIQSFANAFTNRNPRDAEVIVSSLVKSKEASILYADATTEGQKPVRGFKLGKTPPASTDKGILQTKAALERMEEISAHLEVSVQEETSAAKTAALAGNKQEALSRLRKKKLIENKLAGARASALKLSDVLMAVDEAASNKEAVQALEFGMSSLRGVQAHGVSAKRIDAIAADYAEASADLEDVRIALQQTTQVQFEDSVAEEAELEALMAGESTGPLVETPATDEDAELSKIMSELGIAKHDTMSLPTPPQPMAKVPISLSDSARGQSPTDSQKEHALPS